MINPISLPNVRLQPFSPVAHRPEGAGQTKAPDSSDTLELSKKSPQQQLNQKIYESLNGILKQEGAQPIETLNPDDFTPEAVADRILGFIGQAIGLAQANGASDEEIAKIESQARKGVEKGFKDARDILDGMGVLNGTIKEDVDETYDRIMSGLDQVQQNGAARSGEVSALNAIGASAERSISLEVMTQEGDRVTINASRYASASAAEFHSNREGSAISAFSTKVESGFSLEYVVEGQLSEDETAALEDFIKGLDQVADDFFSGNMADVMKSAMDIGINSDELSAFSLTMTHVQTSYAARAYQAVDQIDRGEHRHGPHPVQSKDDPFKDLMQQVRQLREVVDGMFQSPDDTLKGLLSQRLGVDARFDSKFGGTEEEPGYSPEQVSDTLLNAADQE